MKKMNHNFALFALFLSSLTTVSVQAQNIPQAEKNYVIQKVYDDNGNIISYVQVYKDKLGRTQQVQSKDLENDRVIVQQTVYDEFGRAAIQTLPGVSYSSTTNQYLSNFMLNTSGEAFGIEDFDKADAGGTTTGEKFNPKGVRSNSPGELGWYYNNNNTQESHVPASAYPYTRTLRANRIKGAAKASSMAGEELKMGSGHEQRLYFMELGRELQYITGIKEPAYKTISVDEEGLAKISYTNRQGELLAQCYSGLDMGPCSTQVNTYHIQYPSPHQLEKSFVEVHIANSGINANLKLIKNLEFVNTYRYCLTGSDPGEELSFVLEDLLTGRQLVEGTDYNIHSTTHNVTFLGDYSQKDCYLRISMELDPTYANCLKDPGAVDGDGVPAPEVKNAFPLQAVEVTTDYSNWTLYQYNTKHQLTEIYTPQYVDCWTNTTETLIPNKYEEKSKAIGETVECPITLNAVSLESEVFDLYNPTAGNTGTFKFALNILSPAMDPPGCASLAGCNFVGAASGGMWEPGGSANAPAGGSSGGGTAGDPDDETDPVIYVGGDIGGSREKGEFTEPGGEMEGDPPSLHDGYQEEAAIGKELSFFYEQSDLEREIIYEGEGDPNYAEIFQNYNATANFGSDYLLPASSYQYSYNNSYGEPMAIAPSRSGSVGNANLIQEGLLQLLEQMRKELGGDEACCDGAGWASYCGNILHCSDGVQNCDETGEDVGGSCSAVAEMTTTPCTNTAIKKRKGTFKLTLISEGRKRIGGSWEPIDVLSANYDPTFKKVNDQTPVSSLEYYISLNFDCNCDFFLRILKGPRDIRGVLDQASLEVYDKVRFRFADEVYYAPYYGNYTQVYSQITELSGFKYYGRGIGLNYQGFFEEEGEWSEPTHTAAGKTSYTYNDYGQLTSQTSVDEGMVEYWYDDLHRLKLTQTAVQAANDEYTYLDYDANSRVIERGVLSSATDPSPAEINGLISETSYTLSERHYVKYDEQYDNSTDFGANFPTTYLRYKHRYLKGKVTKTANDQSSTWYGYDSRGRLIWTMQYINDLARYVTLNYEYDAKGNLRETEFQREVASENLIHRYSYDANGRLTKVETKQHETQTDYVQHATYEYYQHGPLKRMELGKDATAPVAEQKLQGIDYVYTLNGRLKSINNPVHSRDPGKDGESGSTHETFAEDIFGMTLDYFAKDYVRSGTGIQSYSEHHYEIVEIPGTIQNPEPTYEQVLVIQPSEYNGNINSVRWRTWSEGHTGTPNLEGKQLAYVPQYDKRHRLTSALFAQVGSSYEGIQNTATAPTPGVYDGPSPVAVEDYEVSNVTYDLNGNLSTLKRTGSTPGGIDMDNLSFTRQHNRLTRVDDAITSETYTSDLNDQSGTNYSYDASGRMTGDVGENNYLNYNSAHLPTAIYSNVSKTTQKSGLFYDERGQRLQKNTYSGGVLTNKQYYLRDVSGNLMAIVNDNLSEIEKEHVLYGMGQLGFYDKAANNVDGDARYQFTDHLGNIRATISDTKSGGAAELLSMQDYYPFGSKLPGRSISPSVLYSEGYQGQQEEEETNFNAFELRLYDARIGGWLSPDPYKQHHSPYMAMSNNPLSFIDPDGGRDRPGNVPDTDGGRAEFLDCYGCTHNDWVNSITGMNLPGGGGSSYFGGLSSAYSNMGGYYADAGHLANSHSNQLGTFNSASYQDLWTYQINAGITDKVLVYDHATGLIGSNQWSYLGESSYGDERGFHNKSEFGYKFVPFEFEQTSRLEYKESEGFTEGVTDVLYIDIGDAKDGYINYDPRSVPDYMVLYDQGNAIHNLGGRGITRSYGRYNIASLIRAGHFSNGTIELRVTGGPSSNAWRINLPSSWNVTRTTIEPRPIIPNIGD